MKNAFLETIFSPKTALILLLVLLGGCAVENMPSGGPRDRRPPKVLEITPPNYQTRFSEKIIKLSFDEYVVVKNLKKELLVSPPMAENPDIYPKGKHIIIKLNDSLKANTTYVLNLGNAIVDFNEGNPLKNFSYVFTTGNTIDSLQIAGQVLDAFTMAPPKELKILLYNAISDTLPRKGQPLFVTRTDKMGFFRFTNLPAGKYFVFALNDINSNYRFDLPEETIAFYNTLVSPTVTTRQDSVNDSTVVSKIVFEPDSLQLFSFKEDHEKQYIDQYKRNFPWQCSIIFHRPLKQKPVVALDGITHYAIEYGTQYDTATIWLTDSNETKHDTITAFVSFATNDSLQTTKTDTLDLVWKPHRKKKMKNAKTLKITTQTTLPVYEKKPVVLQFSEPVATITTDRLYMVITDALDKHDTIKPTLTALPEDKTHRYFSIHYPWKYNISYALHFDSATVVSFLGHTNDSTVVKITANNLAQYGSLKIHLRQPHPKPLILFLTDAKGKTIRTRYLSKNDTLITFDLLLPKEYKLKVVIDENGNKKWDTGNFALFKQAERVIFFDKILKVRAGWEGDESWTVKP